MKKHVKLGEGTCTYGAKEKEKLYGGITIKTILFVGPSL
jgi:hypothetical protein